ncbi:M48 family metallopeptidase [Rickettsiales bacterium]|nr:M48 family metallopeptidase [Rickettsiales bacterium]
MSIISPCKIKYGKTDIDYQLQFSDRKTLQIAVHPDKTVFVKSPVNMAIDKIQNIVLKRAKWIKKQISYFQNFEPKTPIRRYVSGESHLYLGKKYRLKITSSDTNKILLKNGYFYITAKSDNSDYIKKLLLDWYKAKANNYFSKIFAGVWDGCNFKNYTKPTLKIREMKARWGSLSQNDTMTINLNLIKTSKECIEYVIIHELCHLVHHNHSPAFYDLLNSKLENWQERKNKLELSLI